MTRTEIKWILQKAIDLLGKETEFMCNAINLAADYSIVHINNVIPEFNRENYHEFIRNNYPELTNYFYTKGLCWIDVTTMKSEHYSTIIESKKAFLKSILQKYTI